ncbi:L-aspartate oxidase [Clostridium sp. LBM24168]
MKRYLAYYRRDSAADIDYYDVIIIGAGISGLYTALMIPEKFKIVILSKKDIYDSDSCLAQGGIAASIEDDDRKLHVKDTLNAGCYINDLNAVDVLVNESEDAIDKLTEMGVEFDKDSTGKYYRSLEGNHSIPRILHVNGDATGKGIMDVLIKRVENAPNIQIITDIFAVDIVTDKEKFTGLTALWRNKFVLFKAGICVMASGGIGQVFSKTTNVDVLTGDGIAMALRAGVDLDNMQYVQFHPTALYSCNVEDRLFLISEAVRGEGAVLRNAFKKRFMNYYDKRMELAPRDIVARAIEDQMKKYNSDYIYLDATLYDRNFLENRFNTIYSKCISRGIEMEKDYVPITPAQHYFMGGIKVDLYGRTNIENLYAVGECSCTGVHGANRLASNSLIEAIVFGKRAAEDISNRIDNIRYEKTDNLYSDVMDGKAWDEFHKIDKNEILRFKKTIKHCMDEKVGIVRNIDSLEQALSTVNSIMDKVENAVCTDMKNYIELYNMCQVSRCVILSALESRTSIGSNYVEEYCKNPVSKS